MLDERPPYELPARASATAGASASVILNNSASRMRQFSSRLDIISDPLVQMFIGECYYARYGGSSRVRKNQVARSRLIATLFRAFLSRRKDVCGGNAS